MALPILRGQSVRGNRALVCLYHFDGNDSNNMVIPLDAGRYGAYARARASLALDRSELLTSRTTNDAEIGFHPAMPEMREFFAQQRLALIANVGSPAGRPVSLLDEDLKYMPGGIAAPHWSAAFTGSGSISPGELAMGSAGMDGHSVVRLSPSTKDVASARVRGFSTQFPETSAGSQLHKVATVLVQSPNEPQFFFVPVPSFGTGANNLAAHAAGLRDLSEAMTAFYEATVELGVSRNVITYTDGAFNRTMAPTSQGRSTPAWGGHQLVLGDSVIGGRVYGSFPEFALGGPDDAAKTGIWIPRIAKAQYHATLARWAGMPDFEIRRAFPSLTDQQPELAFLA
jgi:uncharacterized protein (DUF1501 family)